MTPAVFGILANIVGSMVNSTLDESGSRAFSLASSAIGNSVAKSIKDNYKRLQSQMKNPDGIPQQSMPNNSLSFTGNTY